MKAVVVVVCVLVMVGMATAINMDHMRSRGRKGPEPKKTTTKPVTKPVAKPSTKPVSKPSTKPASKPSTKPVSKPVTKPSTKPVSGGLDGREVIVTMSYMDEEARPVLNAVLRNAKSYSAIYVIERPGSSKDMLWEVPTVTYPTVNQDKSWFHAWNAADKKYDDAVALANGVAVYDKKDAVMDKLQAALIKHLNTLEGLGATLNAAVYFGAKTKTFGKTGWNHFANLYTFKELDTKSNKPVIIVTRTLEMGMNMKIFQIYNELVMKAIKEVSSTIQLYAIGASGAANAKDCVGKMHAIDTSVDVGINIADGKATPVIQIDSIEKGVHAVDSLAPIDLPADVGAAKKLGGNSPEAKARDLFEGGSKRDLITSIRDKVQSTVSGRSFDMTAAYFMGLKTKQEANAVGAHDANTEDYLIIELMNKMKKGGEGLPALKAKGYAVYRADADPYPSDESAAALNLAISDWLKETKACLPKKAYISALSWASQGMDTTAVPESLCWKIPALGDDSFAQATTTDKQPCRLNPLLVEAATDLLADTSTKATVFEGTQVRTAALKVKLAAYNEPDVIALIDELAAFLTTRRGGEPCAKSGEMPIYLLDGWSAGMYKKQTSTFYDAGPGKTWPYTPLINNVEWVFTDTAADRLLYKANNFAVMRVLTQTLFSKSDGPAHFINGFPAFCPSELKKSDAKTKPAPKKDTKTKPAPKKDTKKVDTKKTQPKKNNNPPQKLKPSPTHEKRPKTKIRQ